LSAPVAGGAQGPPGTGKTRTLLALLQVLATANAMQPKRFAQVGPILACGDTNAATDNLVEGLLERGVRVVRIGLPSKVRIARPKLTSLGSQGGCPRLFELSTAEPLKHVRVVSRLLSIDEAGAPRQHRRGWCAASCDT